MDANPALLIEPIGHERSGIVIFRVFAAPTLIGIVSVTALHYLRGVKRMAQ